MKSKSEMKRVAIQKRGIKASIAEYERDLAKQLYQEDRLKDIQKACGWVYDRIHNPVGYQYDRSRDILLAIKLGDPIPHREEWDV